MTVKVTVKVTVDIRVIMVIFSLSSELNQKDAAEYPKNHSDTNLASRGLPH